VSYLATSPQLQERSECGAGFFPLARREEGDRGRVLRNRECGPLAKPCKAPG
jgi:hypothetical protein